MNQTKSIGGIVSSFMTRQLNQSAVIFKKWQLWALCDYLISQVTDGWTQIAQIRAVAPSRDFRGR
jgi:hypothetical protein